MSPNLYLYEALELRSEYDARIKTFRECLPESRENRRSFSFSSDNGIRRKPRSDFNLTEARESLRTLEFKKRKLNPNAAKVEDAADPRRQR